MILVASFYVLKECVLSNSSETSKIKKSISPTWLKKIYFIKPNSDSDIDLINTAFRFYLLSSFIYATVLLFIFFINRHLEIFAFFHPIPAEKSAYFIYSSYLDGYVLISISSLVYFYLRYLKLSNLEKLNFLRLFFRAPNELESRETGEKVHIHQPGIKTPIFIFFIFSIITFKPNFILSAFFTYPFGDIWEPFYDLNIFVITAYLLWCLAYPISITVFLIVLIFIKSYRRQQKDNV